MATYDQPAAALGDFSKGQCARSSAGSPTAVVYSARQAARLIGFGQASDVCDALQALLMPRLRAILAPEPHTSTTQDVLSFFDLIEVRFVAAFLLRGAKLRSMRTTSSTMVRDLATPYPLARQSAYSFRADGMLFEESFRRSVVEAGDPGLSELLSRSIGGYDAVRRQLIRGLKFDKNTGLIRIWAPRPTHFPTIVVNPQVAHGQPAGLCGVPTATLYAAWKAERRDVTAVARLYALPRTDVSEAVRFEQFLGGKRAHGALITAGKVRPASLHKDSG